MHQAKIDHVSALLNTSAHDASVTLANMGSSDPADTLELCTAALVRLNATHAERISHRKAFATAARKTLKQLEKAARS